MAAIFERQHVAKRRKKLSFRSFNKSAGFNAGFMTQFNQNPVRSIRKKNPLSRFSSFMKFLETDKKPLKSTSKYKKTAGKPLKKTPAEKKGSGFTIPFPSLTKLAVIAGIIVIALAAFDWEDLYNKIPEKYIYQPSADSEAERHTMQYAATGIAGILQTQNTGNIAENPAAIGTTAFDNEESSVQNTQNDLITFEWREYKVQRGDSVSVIAQKYNVSVGAIIASNEIRNARTLQEGAVIRIPNIDGIPYQIKRGDSLSKIAVSFNVPLEVILDVNDIKSNNITTGETIFIPGAQMNDIDLRLSLGELFIYPVPSKYITSYYGMRKDPISGVLSFHTGIDLRANTGTAIVAALDGVISVVSENWLYGKHIIISHPNGYKTLYGHLNSFSVKQGDRVVRGKKIGESGNTGYSTGPHLHFSVYDRSNKFVNPLDLLQ
jgi:murein DD-endopeptidase MepM/ murein hydrolase activator NlpD